MHWSARPGSSSPPRQTLTRGFAREDHRGAFGFNLTEEDPCRTPLFELCAVPPHSWSRFCCSLRPGEAGAAEPKPGRRAFRLFASAEKVFTVNRVACRIFSDGSICATGSSTVGGGIWPRGTADQYIFGSGVNIAGIIEAGDRSVNGFAGDTAGAFFNNTAGGNNGEEVRQIFDSNDPADAATWPDEARVPLRGRLDLAGLPGERARR